MVNNNSINNQSEAYGYLISRLNKRKIKHEIHEFESGAIMIDVWHNNHFYVIQFDEGNIGFSQVDDEMPGFDVIPDIKFNGTEEFINKIAAVLN